MSFISFQFAVFFIGITALYFTIPARYKWALLLIGSAYFYLSWVPIFGLLLLFSIVLNYLFGLLIDRTQSVNGRKWVTGCGIAANLVPLLYYKYFNFLNDQLGQWIYGGGHASPLIAGLNVALPIGISFFTFQALSYLIDVHRRVRSAESSVFNYALYHSYFPQLVAGPIERSTRLLPQLVALRRNGEGEKFSFDAERVASGLRLMLWGFFKKLVIADNLALIANEMYAGPDVYSGFQLLMGTYCFAYQIYCDFSGYTDIARGVSRIFGIELMVNFDAPYLSKSIQEFWHRWHISLSSWFRDYVFIPLGGSHTGALRWSFNIVAVFVLSGIWHGANWTFVAWGGLHGFYYLFGRFTTKVRSSALCAVGLDRLPWLLGVLRVVITFHLVLFGWIFFRAQSISDAFLILQKIAIDMAKFFAKALIMANRGQFGFGYSEMMQMSRLGYANLLLVWNSGLFIVFCAIVILEVSDTLRRQRGGEFIVVGAPRWLRWATYYLIVLSIWLCSPFGARQFIYFQF